MLTLLSSCSFFFGELGSFLLLCRAGDASLRPEPRSQQHRQGRRELSAPPRLKGAGNAGAQPSVRRQLVLQQSTAGLRPSDLKPPNFLTPIPPHPRAGGSARDVQQGSETLPLTPARCRRGACQSVAGCATGTAPRAAAERAVENPGAALTAASSHPELLAFLSSPAGVSKAKLQGGAAGSATCFCILSRPCFQPPAKRNPALKASLHLEANAKTLKRKKKDLQH